MKLIKLLFGSAFFPGKAMPQILKSVSLKQSVAAFLAIALIVGFINSGPVLALLALLPVLLGALMISAVYYIIAKHLLKGKGTFESQTKVFLLFSPMVMLVSSVFTSLVWLAGFSQAALAVMAISILSFFWSAYLAYRMVRIAHGLNQAKSAITVAPVLIGSIALLMIPLALGSFSFGGDEIKSYSKEVGRTYYFDYSAEYPEGWVAVDSDRDGVVKFNAVNSMVVPRHAITMMLWPSANSTSNSWALGIGGYKGIGGLTCEYPKNADSREFRDCVEQGMPEGFAWKETSGNCGYVGEYLENGSRTTINRYYVDCCGKGAILVTCGASGEQMYDGVCTHLFDSLDVKCRN